MRVVSLIVLAGCVSAPKASAPVKPPVATKAAPVADAVPPLALRMREYLVANMFYDAAEIFVDAEPKHVPQIASVVTPQLLAAWNLIRDAELYDAKTDGIARAHGEPHEPDLVGAMIAALAPHAPALAARWRELMPEIIRTEQAAHENEMNDPRQRVFVRQDDFALGDIDCIIGVLGLTYPAYKFVEDSAPGLRDPKAPAIQISGHDTTEKALNPVSERVEKVIASAEIELTARHLPAALAKKFKTSIRAHHDVDVKARMKALLDEPRVQALQFDFLQYGEIETKLCRDLAYKLVR